MLNRGIIRKEAAEKRKQYLIDCLINYGYYKMPDGRQLHELSLPELERKYINVRCRIGKAISKDEGA